MTKYVFAQDASKYVGKAVLVGKCKDQHGRSYEFRVIFPNKTFQFAVGLDHVFGDFEYFHEKDEEKILKTWGLAEQR